jgi:hypothetical protein
MLENTRQRNFIERQRQSIHSLRGILPQGISPLEELMKMANPRPNFDPAAYQKKISESLNLLVYSKSVLDAVLAESGESLLLENEGLIPALHHYIDSLKDMPMLKPSCERIAFQMNDMRENLPFRVRVAFYNVAHEAILNLVRHARIESQENGMAVVKFYLEDTTYHLVIQDNGVGFDLAEKMSQAQSFGLIDMLEFQRNVVRRSCRKADLIFQTAPGQGTYIHLWAVL